MRAVVLAGMTCLAVSCSVHRAYAGPSPSPPSSSWRASHPGCEWLDDADPAAALRALRADLGATLQRGSPEERTMRQSVLHRRVTACGGAARARADWARWPWSRAWILGSLAQDMRAQIHHDLDWVVKVEARCNRGETSSCLALARLPNEVVPAPWLVLRPSIEPSVSRATEAALAAFEDSVAPCKVAGSNVTALTQPKVDAAIRVCETMGPAEVALRNELAQLPSAAAGTRGLDAVSDLHASLQRLRERATFLQWWEACIARGGLDACTQAATLTHVASREESDQVQRAKTTYERIQSEANVEAARRNTRAIAAATEVANACLGARQEPSNVPMPTARQRAKILEDVAVFAPEALPEVSNQIEDACGSR